MARKRRGREGKDPSEPCAHDQKFGSDGGSPSRCDGREVRTIRKHPAHGVYPELNKPTIVFLTVCTKGRRPWLASPDVHGRLIEIWNDATAWLVGRYVIMPDHIHLFAAPGETDISLDDWTKYWKSQFGAARPCRASG